MYALPSDRKKYLLRQNKQFKATHQQVNTNGTQQPAYAASYGTSSAPALLPKLIPQLTGDAGLIRRFSIMGWGSGSSAASPVVFNESNSTNGEFNSSANSQDQVSKVVEELPPLQPQNTGSLWANWWTSSGGDKSLTAVDKSGNTEVAKSAKWYIDGLRVGKTPDMKLVKHLITLRVHLSTAKVAFIQDFVVAEKGLNALGSLLASLVGKGGKKRILSELEITVLLEVLKCLRVLLNIEVSLYFFSFLNGANFVVLPVRVQPLTSFPKCYHAHIVCSPRIVFEGTYAGDRTPSRYNHASRR